MPRLRNGSHKTAANVSGSGVGKLNEKSVVINDLLKLMMIIIGTKIYCFCIIIIIFVFHYCSRVYVCG